MSSIDSSLSHSETPDVNPMDNPFLAPESESSIAASPALCCPRCQQHFTLTWKRYVGSPLYNHICPHCGLNGHISVTFTYLVQIFSIALAFCLAIAPLYLLIGTIGLPLVLAATLLGFFLYLDIDRRIQVRRPFKPRKSRS